VGPTKEAVMAKQSSRRLSEQQRAERRREDRERLQRAAEELSQLLYHAQVMMLACDLTLDDVYAHL